MKLRSLLAVLSVLLIVSNCSKSKPELSDPYLYREYIQTYTKGLISSDSEIIIRFNRPPEKLKKGADQNLLKFEPAIDGNLNWVDEQTLVFKPKAPLPSGTEIIANLSLGKVYPDVPDSLDIFKFSFKVIEQSIHVSVSEYFIPEASRPQDYRVVLAIQTNDRADQKDLEACLKIKGIPTNYQSNWVSDNQGTTHQLTLYPVQSLDKEQRIKIEWSGKPIGSKNEGIETIIIPSKSTFEVIGANLASANNQALTILFSQVIDPSQDLTGLIYFPEIQNVNLRYDVEGSKVNCYIDQILEGNINIKVEGSIKSISGKQLGSNYTKTLQFSQSAPGLRLKTNGSIMPDASQLYFPFEAINLHSVEVEVFKIYQTNITQFLQVNTLQGNYELNRVGKIIWRGRVNLESLNPEKNQRDYVQYALDLSKMIKPEPQAIYQIRIGFWKDCTHYKCPDDIPNVDSEEEIYAEDDWYEYEDPNGEGYSIMNAYYGKEGYHRNYRWENRENPCFSEYYNSDLFIYQNILASNIGITLKKSNLDQYLIAVNDLVTAKPIQKASITIYDFQLQPLERVKADRNGLFLGSIKGTPYIVVAEANGEFGYLAISESNSLPLTDFPTEGVQVKDGLQAIAYTERGVWRPGDSIFMNLVLKHQHGEIIPDYPVTLTLYDPRGREYAQYLNNKPTGPVYSFNLSLPADAPTGVWHAQFKAGNATFHKYLRVETIKPNRYKLTLDINDKGLSESIPVLDGKMKAAWLHGASVENQPMQIDLTIKSIPTLFKGYEKFNFDGREPLSRSFTLLTGATNNVGEVPFNIELDNLQEGPGKLQLQFKYRVNEPGGGFSQDFKSIEFYPYQSYAGLSVPKNNQGQYGVNPDEMVTLEFVNIRKDGKPNPQQELSVRILQVEWKWWWERYRNNYISANNASIISEFQSKTLTTDQQGKARWQLSFAGTDRYLIEVCDLNSGHCSTTEFYVYPFNEKPDSEAGLRYFSINLDKEAYQPGENVKFELPALEGGQALVSIESASQILEATMIPLSSKPQTYSLPVESSMVPNVYLNVTIFQPHSRTKDDLPQRIFSIQNIKVEDAKTRITPKVAAPAEMRPDTKYTISVSEENGRDMTYTIALVDEGLLDLTHFKTPDIHAEFYQKLALGVKTWDMYDLVLGGFSGELKRIAAIGGDGAAPKVDGSPKSNRFKPAVVHLGPFRLKGKNKASHTISIPEYVGSVRLMVVASNASAYGKYEQTIPVRKPLMVVGTLPRILGMNEETNLAVTVISMDKKIKTATLKVSEKNNVVKFTSATSKTISFDGPGEKTIYFPIQTTEISGLAKFEFEVTGQGESASQAIEIQVRNPNPFQTKTFEKLLQPGESITFNESLFGTPGTNSAMINAFGLPPIQWENRLKQLLTYPFGCLEQTTSATFPLLYIDALTNLTPEQSKAFQSRIKSGIQHVIKAMDTQGRLTYWPGEQYYHEWSETYAFLMLSLAKQRGYNVPNNAYKAILKTQKQMANQWQLPANRPASVSYQLEQQSLRLYALAIAGEPQIGAMNRLNSSMKGGLGNWLLAAAYARAGKIESGKKLIKDLNTEVSPYRDNRSNFGSDLRDLGLMAISLLEMKQEDKAFLLIRNMASRLNSNQWYSTHSLGISLWAYSAYASGQNNQDQLSIALGVNGKNEQLASDKALITKTLQPNHVNNKPVRLENKGGKPVYVQLAYTGKPISGNEMSASKGIGLSVTYRLAGGREINVSRLPVGTDFIAEVRVTHQGVLSESIKEVALQQIIPAGWEIRNPSMEPGFATTDMPSSPIKYRDIRDDRAYSFFDLNKQLNTAGQVVPQVYYLHLTAAYPGSFYLPAQHAEAMYDASFTATVPGQWVEIYTPQIN
jgi:alpha-2-macroglobulin